MSLLLPAAHRHLGENGNSDPPISNGTKVVMARGASYVPSTPAASYAPMGPFTVTSTVTTTETELVTECSSAPFEPIMSTPESFVVPYPSTSEGSITQPQPVYSSMPSKSTPASDVVPSTSKSKPVYQATTFESAPPSDVMSTRSGSTTPHAVYPTGHYSASSTAEDSSIESAYTASYSKPAASLVNSRYTPSWSKPAAFFTESAYTPSYSEPDASSTEGVYTPSYSEPDASSTEGVYTSSYSEPDASSTEGAYTPSYSEPDASSTEGAYTPSYSKPAANTTPFRPYDVPTPSEPATYLGDASDHSIGAGAIMLAAIAAML